MTKTMSLRLDDEQAQALQLVAAADDQKLTQTIREALDQHIEARRNDPEFQKRLKEINERNAKALERLAK